MSSSKHSSGKLDALRAMREAEFAKTTVKAPVPKKPASPAKRNKRNEPTTQPGED